MGPLEDIVAQVRKQPRDAFARVCRTTFLVQRLERPAPETMNAVIPVALDVKRSHPTDLVVLAQCRFVPILKAGINPFADRIRLGRGADVDIALEHPSISHVHAHFFLRDDGTSVTDAASRNGTRLNGTRLSRSDRVRLTTGDVVTFGDVATTYMGAPELHDLIRSLASL